ncbi:hypothetical protein SBD_4709 [Streptomyces bottropensis ATCC 25435]|uniref:Uncharacterized protein n=1 Tax=Streptomyces bottropensis ATCC 25435 TaxID=1054862 RepID=M3FM64_9ACTN|nr:hypothetical protein SBD_4709 [Streptomyces bottropensis ATCC 25435]
MRVARPGDEVRGGGGRADLVRGRRRRRDTRSPTKVTM